MANKSTTIQIDPLIKLRVQAVADVAGISGGITSISLFKKNFEENYRKRVALNPKVDDFISSN